VMLTSDDNGLWVGKGLEKYKVDDHQIWLLHINLS